MRVLIVNTSDKTGGAAVAAHRLKEALNENGVEAKMVVRDKITHDDNVLSLHHNWKSKIKKLWERWCIFLHLHCSRNHLFEIDIANAGNDITHLKAFQEADIIHLSWINQGMLSLKNIRRILQSGKPVVWTMHDLWPASSICHYAHGCLGFKQNCGNCPLLPNNGHPKDLSYKVFQQKKALFQRYQVSFVACSRWLSNQAKESGLLQNQFVTDIPNPIDTHLFKPLDKEEVRKKLQLPLDKKIILFVSQRVTDKRKGMEYFIQAIQTLVSQHPEWKQQAGIAILGADSEEIKSQIALPTYSLGYVNDAVTIRNIYNSADLFVLPSLEDNLPNTIMESMACGLPCVGFNVGGIPEMIDHHINGYIAAEKDAQDLAKGMHWVLAQANYTALSEAAVQKVHNTYSNRKVAERYKEIYQLALNRKK